VIALKNESRVRQRCARPPREARFDELAPDTALGEQYLPAVRFSAATGATVVRMSGASSNAVRVGRGHAMPSGTLVMEFAPPVRTAGLRLGVLAADLPSSDVAVLAAFDPDGAPMGEVTAPLPDARRGMTGYIGVGATFPDQPIARLELHYTDRAGLTPMIVDDLVTCQAHRPVPVPKDALHPQPAAIPADVGVDAELVMPARGPKQWWEPTLVREPLAGVPVQAAGRSATTPASVTLSGGESLRLNAPTSQATAAGEATFSHWRLGDRALFPEDQREVSVRPGSGETLTAVYRIDRRCPWPW
jgi:hypothetical protein